MPTATRVNAVSAEHENYSHLQEATDLPEFDLMPVKATSAPL